jgi:hypothetical protein
MNKPNNDTVSVRLSSAGLEAAAGGPLSIHGGSVPLTFTGSIAQDVHRAVYAETLAPTAPFGEPWFELVPASPATPAAATKPTSPVSVPQPKPAEPPATPIPASEK